MTYPISFPLIFCCSFGDNRSSSLPHSRILPLCCARSLSKPSIALHTELLPLPLSPIKPNVSPRAMEKSILRIFVLSFGYSIHKPFTERTGVSFTGSPVYSAYCDVSTLASFIDAFLYGALIRRKETAQALSRYIAGAYGKEDTKSGINGESRSANKAAFCIR